ncbi:hypothetical protein [Parabacteroides sp. PF5-9]|uniref:hypothetical protein n=1 Tax=Parabacteroides sp. PF5-9 TaxID=1742404 RepID=UPI002475DF75|nr:hypothetical protein [Parabacteroides sp. PF5-9]
MKKLSTHCMNDFNSKTEPNPKEKECHPQKQTLDFLTQLARVYHVEPALEGKYNGYVMN